MAKSSAASTSKSSPGARVRLITAAVAAGLPVARDLWSLINKDDRAAKAVRDTWTKARHGVDTRTPLGHAEATLDAVVEFAKGSDHPDARRWLSASDEIRSRLALVKMQKGRDRRIAIKEVRKRSETLLGTVIDATA
ncbi:hypothetical protein [Acidipropionibacterium virtanenii]|uniref:Uncharacterized protein n=1 Tax=Acidipropionibacterium virtanenii TaxID=2057246 RepID=A0A344USZ5_9ACTN|nr:hypothetical protein [Acidipropionibacterium virtanenii]AXE38393.1 hypothetical protein JS278_01217 [Acidipropionibacterium virtanenii]